MLALLLFSLLAQPSEVERGRVEYQQRCLACHTPERNQVGPRHRGVVGRKAGSVEGFDYSPALRASGLVWTPALLDRWLTNPEKLVPGQKMWVTVDEPEARQALIAYLRSL